MMIHCSLNAVVSAKTLSTQNLRLYLEIRSLEVELIKMRPCGSKMAPKYNLGSFKKKRSARHKCSQRTRDSSFGCLSDGASSQGPSKIVSQHKKVVL